MGESLPIFGCFSLTDKGNETYEISRLAVTRTSRGRGIGQRLLEKCLDVARTRHAKKIMLYSNSKLKVAARLYEKFGFYRVPVRNSIYLTADVQMELMFLNSVKNHLS